MSEWQLSADVLAGARFELSPLLETSASTMRLADETTAVEPWHRTWVARHRPALRARLNARPVWRRLLEASMSDRWVADCLAWWPASGTTFREQVSELRQRSDEQVLQQLAEVPNRAPNPNLTRTAGLGGHLADLLTWVWDHAVEPDWSRRAAVLHADVVARTSRLSTGGWIAALADLREPVRYLSGGTLIVSHLETPPRDLRAAELRFCPLSTTGGFVAWSRPTHFAVCYPAAGFLVAQPEARDALSRLLGPRRANLLLRLTAPSSTSSLAAITGWSQASVSENLSALTGAGLTAKRRSGRSVLYWRTDLGDRLLDGDNFV